MPDMTPEEAAGILRHECMYSGVRDRTALEMGAEAIEILAWMESEIGECSWAKKSWNVIAGRPDIVCLKPGVQLGGTITYATMLGALRAAKKASRE